MIEPLLAFAAVVLAQSEDPLVPFSGNYAIWNEHAPGSGEDFTRLSPSRSEFKTVDFASDILVEVSKPSTH